MPTTTRRHFLHTAAATGLAAAAGSRLLGSSTTSGPAAAPATGGFRFVFLPCIHLRPERGAAEGFAAALRAAQALDPAPDFLLTGGDLCHNLRDRTLDEAEKLADEFAAILKREARIPVYHCLGNHDLAGWSKPAEYAADPRYGKSLLMKKLGLPAPYHQFEHGGWRFLVLDYLQVRAPGDFTAEIDSAQLAWLRAELAAAPAQPMVVISHAPLASVVETFSDRAKTTTEGRFAPYGRVIANAPEVFAALAGTNVRACLSGHLHLVEELSFSGHRLICAGAVSGQQWGGPRQPGHPEGIAVCDCAPDGTFTFRYHATGWRSRA